MNFKNDLFILSERYLHTVCESSGQIPPDAKQKFEEGIRKLAERAVEGDKEAIEILTNPAKAEEFINQSAQQSSQSQQGGLQTEAFEKFRAKIGAKLAGSDPVQNRYNLFLRDINGHLWEIDKDSRQLNVEPKEVNQFINNIVSIEPAVDKEGKLLQKIGYGIGKTVGAAMFAAPFAIGVSYFGPLIGVYGLTAKAVAAAIAGGGKVATLLNNKQLSKGEKVGEIVRVAGLAFAMTASTPGVADVPASKAANVADTAATGASKVSINDADIIKDWPKLTKTVFGRMTDSGTPSFGSAADSEALTLIKQKLTSMGADWNTLNIRQKAEILNPIVKTVRAKYNF